MEPCLCPWGRSCFCWETCTECLLQQKDREEQRNVDKITLGHWQIKLGQAKTRQLNIFSVDLHQIHSERKVLSCNKNITISRCSNGKHHFTQSSSQHFSEFSVMFVCQYQWFCYIYLFTDVISINPDLIAMCTSCKLLIASAMVRWEIRAIFSQGSPKNLCIFHTTLDAWRPVEAPFIWSVNSEKKKKKKRLQMTSNTLSKSCWVSS